MSRPEYAGPPEIYYGEDEANRYATNSHIAGIQRRLSERALELALLPQDRSCLILDLGCGSGISSRAIQELGHVPIGVDISESMLDVARRADDGDPADLILADLGQPLKFRPGSFDGAISISAVQWLCNADAKNAEPFRRLRVFFQWLFAALAPGARAALQFYPDGPAQAEMITAAALRCGFQGGLVVDFPNSTRAKKYFLCLWGSAPSHVSRMPQPMIEESEGMVKQAGRDRVRRSKADRRVVKGREWVLTKKEKLRKKGLEVRRDTKYTARKRRDKF